VVNASSLPPTRRFCKTAASTPSHMLHLLHRNYADNANATIVGTWETNVFGISAIYSFSTDATFQGVLLGQPVTGHLDPRERAVRP
jgi:hypothetical protein